MILSRYTLMFLAIVYQVSGLLPPKFNWKLIEYDWQGDAKEKAIQSGAFVPENNLPVGVARWKNKVFITVPRWKNGVPSSLNYVDIDGPADQPLKPYPSWADSFVEDNACCTPTNKTVVSTFRVHVDKCDRLWIVDTGVSHIAGNGNQITAPSVMIFDLNNDELLLRYPLNDEAVKGPESFFTSITVETLADCVDSYAYISDMGANSLVVYSLKANTAWRVDHPYFHFDPHAGVYSVAGIDFYWSDGISSIALSPQKADGNRDLYFSPVSSTKQFKISTDLLRNKNVQQIDLFNGVEVLGDRGPKSQSTACDLDEANNVLFYTQVSKNGIGCWNVNKEFNTENTPVIVSDCKYLEFPNDVKVDYDNNLWILSDKMPRFLYSELDPNEYNFIVMTASVANLVQGTPCEKLTGAKRIMSFIRRKSG